MAYFHIDRAESYIQSLGFGDANANGIDDRSPARGRGRVQGRQLLLLPGDPEDQVRKRWHRRRRGRRRHPPRVRALHPGRPGPGVRSRQSAPAAIGEGFGDFWAAAMSALSPDTTNADDVCIFDWDGVCWGRFVPAFHRKCWAARGQSQDPRRQAQASCRFEIHCVGQVWSSALWALRTKYGIGAATFDRIVLSSQFMYTANEPFGAAVNALVKADQSLTGGAHKAAICTEMATKRAISASSCP